MAATSSGTIRKPAALAPVSARFSASPRRAWNQRPTICVMAVPEIAAQPKAMPA